MESLLAETLPLVLQSFSQVARAEEGPSLRLGFGQFVDAERAIARRTGCQHFLDVVVAVEPRVLDDLRSEACAPVLQFLMRKVMEIQSDRITHDTTPDQAFDRLSPAWESDFEELFDILETPLHRWMARWRLGTPEQPWGAPAFMWTLFRWALEIAAGQEPDARLWYLPLAIDGPSDSCSECGNELPPLLMDEVVLAFPDLSWNRRMETRAAAEARLGRALKEHLRDQLDRAELDARARGDVPVATRPSGFAHFEWLAHYQILGESFNDIARANGVHRQSVAEAIKDTATIIDLPLREPDRPGRRRNLPGRPRIVRIDRRPT